MIFLIEAYVGTSWVSQNFISCICQHAARGVPLPARVHSIAFAHFGENRQHLLHGEMGFIAHADDEQIVDNSIILQWAL